MTSKKSMYIRMLTSASVIALFSLNVGPAMAQMQSANYMVTGGALTGPSGGLGAPYGKGSIPGAFGASAVSTNYALNSISAVPSAITHDLPPLGGPGQNISYGGGVFIPDKVSVQTNLGLAGNESGVLRYNLTDGKIVQLDLMKYSFSTGVNVKIVENKLPLSSRPLSKTPVTLIGNTSFNVQFNDSTGKAVDPQKSFQLTVFQAPGKPMPNNAAVYYFDDQTKVWVKVDSSLAKNNYITFFADKGKQYAVFAGSTDASLLATDSKTILDVNKDGKVDRADRDVVVPEYRRVTPSNDVLPRAYVPGIVKGVKTEKELEEGIEANWNKIAERQEKGEPLNFTEGQIAQKPEAVSTTETDTPAPVSAPKSMLPTILVVLGVILILSIVAIYTLTRKPKTKRK